MSLPRWVAGVCALGFGAMAFAAFFVTFSLLAATLGKVDAALLLPIAIGSAGMAAWAAAFVGTVLLAGTDVPGWAVPVIVTVGALLMALGPSVTLLVHGDPLILDRFLVSFGSSYFLLLPLATLARRRRSPANRGDHLPANGAAREA